MSGGFAAPIETAVPPLTWLTTLSPQSRAQPMHHSRNTTLTVAQLYITERFESEDRIDTTVICENIERTMFPLPFEEDHQESEDFPGLIRAADLIGQLGDPLYHRKIPPLFAEFKETGHAAKMGYTMTADLGEGYLKFFWQVVTPFIAEGVRLLRRTQEGQKWVANLYANVFTIEHEAPA